MFKRTIQNRWCREALMLYYHVWLSVMQANALQGNVLVVPRPTQESCTVSSFELDPEKLLGQEAKNPMNSSHDELCPKFIKQLSV